MTVTIAMNEIEAALARACAALLRHQHPDGRFDGDIDQGTGPTAQTVILERFLGVLDPRDAEAACQWLWTRVQTDGGYLAYPGASFSTMTETCGVYAAFVAAGLAEDDPRRVRVRGWIDRHGGMRAADPLTQVFLVLGGALPAGALPEARIEQVLLPGMAGHVGRAFQLFYGITLAYILPALLHGLRRRGEPRSALTLRAEQKIVEHLLVRQNPGGNWAGSQWVTGLALASLVVLGVPADHDAVTRGLACLRRLRRPGPEGLQIISLNADVWNTAMSLRVLRRAGVADRPDAVAPDGWTRRAIDYLLAGQAAVASPVDWTNTGGAAPRCGGWAFESENPLSTDCDSTSVVLLALADYRALEGVDVAMRRGFQWLLSMQHAAGGFGAFGRPTRVAPPGPLFLRQPEAPKGLLALARFFARPPFEFVEIPTADLTGRVVCALATVEPGAAALVGAVRFLHDQQWGDKWWGRWTTNYLAGTSFVALGLLAAGVAPDSPALARALAWTLARQNADGGFGEVNESYADPGLAGRGPSNAYITGLVLQTLCAAGLAGTQAAALASRYLVVNQGPDGLWEEFQAVQSMAPPELFYKNFVNFQTAPIEALAVYCAAKRGSS